MTIVKNKYWGMTTDFNNRVVSETADKVVEAVLTLGDRSTWTYKKLAEQAGLGKTTVRRYYITPQVQTNLKRQQLLKADWRKENNYSAMLAIKEGMRLTTKIALNA